MNAVRVGFLGLGTVGSGAVRALREGRERIAARVGAEVIAVRAAVRDLSKPRPVDLTGLELTTDPLAVAAAPDLDVIVEVIGGVGVAREGVTAALRAGKAVVTANKELLAKHGRELFALADEHGGEIAFEGAVAGGIPILRALGHGLAGNRIREVIGIINGTTNYILSSMTATGRPYAELLAEAQAAGYAEPDPTNDVAGHDAAYKLAILAMLSFDTWVDIDAVARDGITRVQPADIAVAGKLGYVVKLLGIARRRPLWSPLEVAATGDLPPAPSLARRGSAEEGIELGVHPTLVPKGHPLAAVNDVYNAIFVEGSSVGRLMFYGRGAGDGPTGSAVVGDLIEVARHRCNHCRAALPPLDADLPLVPTDEVSSRYYVRMRVLDRAGVLAKLAGILGEEQVSVAQMLQTESDADWAEIVWITHPTSGRSIERSLARMAELEVVVEVSNVLHCLESGE
ncbi:MAG: homoserine dehydrogenase [Armatimonadetes bacterium]|nr:homoserine dehydrogenase [Armatimonadota bacterium]